MKSDRTNATPNGDQSKRNKRYHPPTLQDYGNARDLTRSNAGSGGDGAFSDGVDGGLDGPGTAS